jgi:Flp pilus assembly pilin Flp
MIRRANVVITVIPLGVAACRLASAQQPPTVTLIVDLGNTMEYQDDIYDPVKFARSLNVTPSLGFGTGIANFGVATLLGDIVAVNGQPARGLYAGRSRVINANPNPRPGQAIADVTRVAIREHIFEILQPDSTPIGSIMAMGFSGGDPPPGQSRQKRNGEKMNSLRNFWNDDQGQDLIEYSLLMAFVALASSALFLTAGGSISGSFSNSQCPASTISSVSGR